MIIRLLTICVLLACLAGNAFAWGSKGHKVVGLIAEQHLSAEAAAQVRTILAAEGYRSLDEITIWADHVRHLKVPRQPSHKVSLREGDTPYDPSVDCSKRGCAISTIVEAIAVLRDSKAHNEAKLFMLKYLVHLVGDLHTPLHATAAGTKEQVSFLGKEMSLHRLWDVGLISATRLDPDQIVVSIDPATIRAAVTSQVIDPVEWAYEGRRIVENRILVGDLAQSGYASYDEDYLEQNWPIVQERLGTAGGRLAMILNDIFAATPKAKSEPDHSDEP
jgi:S1/P1 Nuclease.